MRASMLILTLAAIAFLAGSAEAVDLRKIDRSIRKEPVYESKDPRYCLLAFGAEANVLVWLVFDGDMGYGQVIAREATQWGIAKAQECGLAAFAIRNTHPVARVGTYGELAARAGLVVDVLEVRGDGIPGVGLGEAARAVADLGE